MRLDGGKAHRPALKWLFFGVTRNMGLQALSVTASNQVLLRPNTRTRSTSAL
jgi:hypothetical protein